MNSLLLHQSEGRREMDATSGLAKVKVILVRLLASHFNLFKGKLGKMLTSDAGEGKRKRERERERNRNEKIHWLFYCQ